LVFLDYITINNQTIFHFGRQRNFNENLFSAVSNKSKNHSQIYMNFPPKESITAVTHYNIIQPHLYGCPEWTEKNPKQKFRIRYQMEFPLDPSSPPGCLHVTLFTWLLSQLSTCQLPSTSIFNPLYLTGGQEREGSDILQNIKQKEKEVWENLWNNARFQQI
jgi:hypothetical protein